MKISSNGSEMMQQMQQMRQKRPPKPPTQEQMTNKIDELAEKLSLTDEQKGQFTSLFTQHFDQMRSQMSSGERPDKETMDANKSAFDSQLRSLLSTEQQEVFDTLPKGRRR